MTQDIFTIQYPQISVGTEKTDILFYNSSELDSLMSFLSPNDGLNRIFVTDSTIISLPSLKVLAKDFLISAEALSAGIPPRSVFRKGNNTLVILGAGESYKTIENVLFIIQTALESGLQRSSVFVGIGGGVICDMTAFASSIFKRGAKLELVPTTLLAMVDAAVGGKTGCDFDSFKNMIGTFYPAKRLHVFSDFLQTLPPEEYRSGLAETLKTALLYAPKLFHIMQNQKDEVLARETDLVRQIIRRCVIAKASIVEKDLTETGLRMQLNLGHTFAHALETTAGLGAIPHGDAVAWGSGRALQLSVNLGLCEEEYRQEVDQVLESYGWCRTAYHPVLEGKVSPEEAGDVLLSAMKKDKKNSNATVRFILQREINSTVIQEVPDDKILAVLEAKP